MSTETVQLRAAITDAEHRQLKKQAVDAKVTQAEYVAQLLRKGMRDGR